MSEWHPVEGGTELLDRFTPATSAQLVETLTKILPDALGVEALRYHVLVRETRDRPVDPMAIRKHEPGILKLFRVDQGWVAKRMGEMDPSSNVTSLASVIAEVLYATRERLDYYRYRDHKHDSEARGMLSEAVPKLQALLPGLCFVDSNDTQVRMWWADERLHIDASVGGISRNHIHTKPRETDSMARLISKQVEPVKPPEMRETGRGFLCTPRMRTAAGVEIGVVESSAFGPPRTRIYFKPERTPVSLSRAEAADLLGRIVTLRASFKGEDYWRNTPEYQAAYCGGDE